MTITTQVKLPAIHPFSGMDLNTALAERRGRLAEKTFLIWEPGEGAISQWTYASFGADVDRTAAGLISRGVRRGDGVAIYLENCPAFLICWFACARIGAVAVNTNVRYAPNELRHVLDVSEAVAVITHKHLLEALESSGAEVSWVETIDETTGTCPSLYSHPARLPLVTPDAGAPICVQFTSGTSDRPKAVVFTHANALWAGRVSAEHARLSSEDTFLVYPPLFHTAALYWHTLATFWVGGTVVLMPKYSRSRFWDVSIRHRCTHSMLLGITIATLTKDPVPDHHYKSFQFGLQVSALADYLKVNLFNVWGMTEVITQVIHSHPVVPAREGAIGRVSTEYQVRIAVDNGEDAPAGEAGELLVGGVRGLSLFAEYLNDPEATAQAFDEKGYFRTGDRVMQLPNGEIQFISRSKDMLKVGGENVAAGEIERVLAGVSGVQAAAVVSVPDDALDEVPIAFVALVEDAHEEDIVERAFTACHTELAPFKVPRAIYAIAELPESLLGKIAKATLRDEAIKRWAVSPDRTNVRL